MFISRRFIQTSIIVTFVLGLGCYYLYVFSLYPKREVSEAFDSYYVDKKTRFYSRYQDLYIIKGQIFDTTWERPYFLSREGFDYPDYTGKGINFLGKGGFYFKLHDIPKTMSLYIKLVTDVPNTLTLSNNGSIRKVDLLRKGSFEVLLSIDTSILASKATALQHLGFTSSAPIRIFAIGFK